MAKNNLGNILGSWAFLAGVILAVIAGILAAFGNLAIDPVPMTIALVIIGLLVGLFNITNKESNAFLMSGIVLILASAFGVTTMNAIPVISAMLAALLQIFIPAIIIVAIRNAFIVAKS